MKQTAVEWLQELELQRDLTLEDYEQAKAMEKEQLRKAYLADPYNAICGFEQYYNETFKSE